MIGQTVSHFRILSQIGEGGMGVVYKAEDQKLRRPVALKVLPPGFVGDEERRRRFLREARAAAAVAHPNIATIHEVDEADGVVFIAMELVEGTTLRQMLVGRPLPIQDAVRIGAEIAEGLAGAHQARVIHRDLKPENVMVRPDGHVKILDFGLAKLHEERMEASLSELSHQHTLSEQTTREGRIVGTAAYMSPEQARGKAVDARSDLFALGTTLYEMVTGRRPFQGASYSDTLSAILRDLPTPAGKLNPKVSPDLERVILKCLEKAPEHRYQSAKEIAVDLQRLATTGPLVAGGAPRARPRRTVWSLTATLALLLAAAGTYLALQRTRARVAPSSGRLMLAVLPFENLSADPEQEFFSDGMTEEMMAHVGRLQPQRLGVIARTSVMRYKGARKPVDQIARDLGVDYIVEGSVRRAAGRVRITAQLIQARDQTQLWAESYDRDLADILAIQDDVARRIVQSLALELLPRAQTTPPGRRPINPEALVAYLKARYYLNKRTEGGLKKAAEHFREAILSDPHYAEAFVGMAEAYLLFPEYGSMRVEEALALARPAVEKALELDKTLSEAHTALAYLHELDWNWASAEEEFRRAIELNPNYATAHHWYGIFLRRMARFDESLQEIKRALELDPGSPAIAANLPYHFYCTRQFERAIAESRKVLEMDPSFPPFHRDLGGSYEATGRYEKAIAEYGQAIALSGGHTAYKAYLARCYALAGRRVEARQALAELEELRKQKYVSSFDVALVHIGLGDKERAFAWLEMAYEGRDGSLAGLKANPRLDPLRPDPRFQDLVRRVGLPP